MAAIDSLCVLVEVGNCTTLISADTPFGEFIKRVVRSYESRTRAEEDLELLQTAAPGARYRIDDITHIER